MFKVIIRVKISFLLEIKYKIKNLRILFLRLCKNFVIYNK